MMQSIKLLVLAGGFGTRLKSVVSEVPKPMAPVDNQPFLKYLVEMWFQQGVRSFTFLLYHKASQIEEYLLSNEIQELLKNCDILSSLNKNGPSEIPPTRAIIALNYVFCSI